MIYQPLAEKRCPKCQRYLPASLVYFTSSPKRRFGLYTYCKECDHKRMYDWKQANLEKRRAQARESARRGKIKNPERVRQNNSRGGKRYFQNHKKEAYARAKRRKARELDLVATFTEADWSRALSYFGGRCAYCGRPQGFWHTLAQDHFVPVKKGGGYEAGNIVPACQGIDGCNNSKYDKDPIEWAIRKFGKQKAQSVLKRIQNYFEWVKVSQG